MRTLILLSCVLAYVAAECMPGGYCPLQNPESNLMLQEIVQFALTTYAAKTNSVCDTTYKIRHAETQVVAGLNYKMTVEATCGGEKTVCDFVVFDQSWTKTRELTSDHCSTGHRRLAMVGGMSHADTTSAQFQDAMKYVASQVDLQSNGLYRSSPVHYSHCFQQVVAGMRYVCDITMAENDCTKIDSRDLSLCSVKSQGMSSTWHVDIVSQPWMASKYTMTELTMVVDLGVVQQNPKVLKINKLKEKFGRNLKFDAMQKIKEAFDCKGDCKLKSKFGKKFENLEKALLGGDGHDLKPHGKSNLIGGDGHDLKPHGKSNLIGGDGHDLKPHGKSNLIGGDGHDLKPHGKSNLIGGDGHDLKPHGKSNLIGGDGHDLKPHGKSNLIGGDGHDLKRHGKSNLIGGDGHDLKRHGKSNLIGGDGHDLKPHGKSNLLGGDGHDLKPHGNSAPEDGGSFGLLLNGSPMLNGDVGDLCQWGVFQQFQERFKRLYMSKQEEKTRFKIFCENMRKAKKLQDVEKGTAVYGITKFSDMSESEFKQYVGKVWDQNANKGMKKAAIPDIKSLPKSFDWREKGAVTEVKNQGSCGSCWAFSTTGNIEGQWAIQKKKLISLSEQELVDCDKVDEGCNGGLPSQAYKEIIRLGGLETEAEYKYRGHNEKCSMDKSKVRVKINGSVSISSNETEMAAWLVKNGPISIGINAFAMQFYMGGISHPWKIFCNPKELDHGVLIVGYGVDGSKPYWIVKNSWGPDWGEKGYYLVYRGAGVCGLNTMCTSAVVN
uniref:Uncharacterized protein LOC111129849 isoform X2 n=1 Tax=Crassostrea virginica TaxID=6565 RepID=A0A8B8DWP6_CRAVI|nr:uncharacterized protein LOC111129849 isoform X2 [Crassostrea virginica]